MSADRSRSDCRTDNGRDSHGGKATATEALGVESETLIRHHYVRPFNHSGTENVSNNTDWTCEV